MDRKFKQRLRLGLATAIIVLCAMVALAVRTVKSFSETSGWVLHTQEVRLRLVNAQATVIDVETGARGYILTGDERLLGPYDRGLESMPVQYAQLQKLVKDNPAQQKRLATIAPIAKQWLESIKAEVEARRRGQFVAPSTATAGAAGSDLVNQIRDQVGSMEQEERRLLEFRLDAARGDAERTVAALGFGLLLDFLLVLALGWLLSRDLAARDSSAAQLKKSAETTLELYNRAPCGYHSLDENGLFVAINDTELRWLGYTRTEVLGKLSFVDVLTPASREVFHANFQRFKKEGFVKDVEFELVTKEGRTFPVLLNSDAVVDAQGRYVSSRSTIFDITERKRAERITQEARSYAESIVDTVREPLLILTPELVVNSANRSFYRTFNTKPELTVGQSFPELNGGVWATTDLIAALQSVVPQDATLEKFEVAGDFPLIGPKVMLLNARKLTRFGSDAAFILLAIDDITESKRAHEELEAFSYSVSHDLRAPLRHIAGFGGMLQSHLGAALDEKGTRYLKTIVDSTKRLGQLIDDLLAFSRIGRAEMNRRRVSLDGVCREARQNLSDIAGRTITWKISPLPEVLGDASLLTQVFANLLDNAAKYTRGVSEPLITVEARQDGAKPGEVLIVIRDNGAGFDMRYVDKLFGVFQRLHSSTEFEGTGVGLANVRRIIQRHGGRVWAEGEVGVGASFYFTLPAAGPQEAKQRPLTSS